MKRPVKKGGEYTDREEYKALFEYTPVYPDVSFFRESAVTTHEENVFCGEAPPGERQRRRKRKKDKEEEKKKKEYALRMLLRSAVRAGAAVLAAVVLISVISLNGGFGTKTGAAVAAALAPAKARTAFNETQLYTNAELLSLWNGEENAPHKYDYANPVNVLPATCKTAGYAEYVCSVCGITHKVTTAGVHVPGAEVTENAVAATCGADGGHDLVVYCSVCGDEVSRTHVTDKATGAHTPLPSAAENANVGNCTAGGTYEEVTYCAVCGKELSRVTKATAASGHTAGDEQIKEHKDATCTENGYTITAVYCTVCGEELSSNKTMIPVKGHNVGFPVEENRTEPTCTSNGVCDEVYYCLTCGAELGRNVKTLYATGHTAGAAVSENSTAATCTAAGHYDSVVYCTVCGAEMSRTAKTSGVALSHDFPVPTNGSQTPRCSRCGEEAIKLSYDKTAKKFSYTIDREYYTSYISDKTVSLDVCDSVTGSPVCEPMYNGQAGDIDAVGTTAKPGDKVYLKLTIADPMNPVSIVLLSGLLEIK